MQPNPDDGDEPTRFRPLRLDLVRAYLRLSAFEERARTGEAVDPEGVEEVEAALRDALEDVRALRARGE